MAGAFYTQANTKYQLSMPGFMRWFGHHQATCGVMLFLDANNYTHAHVLLDTHHLLVLRLAPRGHLSTVYILHLPLTSQGGSGTRCCAWNMPHKLAPPRCARSNGEMGSEML